MEVVNVGSYDTRIIIFVGDRVYNHLDPSNEFIVKSIEKDEDTGRFYIDGWSIEHFSKTKNQPPIGKKK